MPATSPWLWLSLAGTRGHWLRCTAATPGRSLGWPGESWETPLSLKRWSKRSSSGSGTNQGGTTPSVGASGRSCSPRCTPEPLTCCARTLRGAEREVRDARSTASGQYDVEHEFLDIAVAEGVRDALGVLQPGERSAIELAYFGGHTYREVAVILGEPEGTIKSRIRSGMRRMHSSLAAKGLAVGKMQPAEENP